MQYCTYKQNKTRRARWDDMRRRLRQIQPTLNSVQKDVAELPSLQGERLTGLATRNECHLVQGLEHEVNIFAPPCRLGIIGQNRMTVVDTDELTACGTSRKCSRSWGWYLSILEARLWNACEVWNCSNGRPMQEPPEISRQLIAKAPESPERKKFRTAGESLTQEFENTGGEGWRPAEIGIFVVDP